MVDGPQGRFAPKDESTGCGRPARDSCGAGARRRPWTAPVFNTCPGPPVVAVTEFYAPFAHLPGRLEWCRIRSPTHGVFDTCIVIEKTTADPVTVYVNSEAGERFMTQRFPESTAIRVPANRLVMQESDGGLRLQCRLRADRGPVRRIDMQFRAQAALPREVPYGGGRCWGSRYTCTGVDLELDADVTGLVRWADRDEPLAGGRGIVTVGSMGTLTQIETVST